MFANSSTPIAVEGHPIPVDITLTGLPLYVPVNVLYSLLKAISFASSKFADHSKLDKLNDEDFINIYKVNVIGPYQMIRAVEPIMKKNGFGAVVNISSIAGKVRSSWT